MLNLLKRIFNDPDRETIKIFEETTKIEYSQDIFLALKAISLSNVNLKNLKPISVFKNLEILNLDNNKIKDITCLKDLNSLKILDLRFNKIEKLPPWVFESRKKLYWNRYDENQEGIFLEGNPLNRSLISKLKRNTDRARSDKEKSINLKKVITPTIPKDIKKNVESSSIKLIPLNRQQVTIFSPQNFHSSLIDILLNIKSDNQDDFKLKISQFIYDKEYEILKLSQKPPLSDPNYIILILKSVECCLNPPILTSLLKIYSKSKLFLIIEDESKKNIEDKIVFFKQYNKSNNILKIYHIFDKDSAKIVNDKIYNFLKNTKEAKSIWKKEWIYLRDEIEKRDNLDIDKDMFYILAQKYKISNTVIEELYNYFKKVGLIQGYSKELCRVSGFI